MPPTNHAAWIKTKQASTITVQGAPYTSPQHNEVVVKVKAIAMNPVDAAMWRIGFIIPEDKYPAIVGCDVAGEVVEVGSALKTSYAVGDRVLGQCSFADFVNNEVNFLGYQYSAFQEYVVIRTPLLTKIPAHIEFKDAAVLPLALYTAATCMLSPTTLDLDPPTSISKPGGKRKTLIIWGASSSVGSCGVQLAIQAGYDVVGIASKKNHEFVKSLGAVAMFDQSDPDIVRGILSAAEGKSVVAAYDATANKDSVEALCQILSESKAEQQKICAVLPTALGLGIHGVQVVFNGGANAREDGKGSAVFEWAGKALEDGRLKCAPPAEIVGHGLSSVQKALDLMSKGVSAKKLVVTV
jgi:NADPH:quinone reductase-like Zn-dependent oxidoreductase